MRIGIIGAGAIAQFLLSEIEAQPNEGMQVTGLLVRDRKKYLAMAEQYQVDLYTDLHEFIHSDVDVIVEAATIQAVYDHLPAVIQAKDTVVISVGAFADDSFYEKISGIVDKGNCQLLLPAGAIGGLDMVQSANALGGLKEVSLTTTKPAHSLVDRSLTQAEIIFEGSAREAIAQFPKNMNVAIVLSLAGIGLDETKVKLIADPNFQQNVHQIQLNGAFGSAETKLINRCFGIQSKNKLSCSSKHHCDLTKVPRVHSDRIKKHSGFCLDRSVLHFIHCDG